MPPKELYKYLDNVYELIGTLNRNHYANYHFRECFIDESNIETLIEEKESNQLLVQAFRYITNLLVNINSSVGSSVEQRRPSQTVLTDSGSVNQGRIERRDQTTSYNILGNNSSNLHYSVQEVQEEGDVPMYPPNPTPNLNTSKNLNLNAVSREIDVVQPHSFGDAAPLSQQDLGFNTRTQSNNNSKAYSPSNSRYVASNSYSNKANTDVNTTRRLELSRNPSAKSGVSASPNNRRDKSPTSNKHATDVNALNVSKQSIARSHVSQRTAGHQNAVEANAALNASRHSQANPALNASRVSQRTTRQNAVEANAALNASRQSQGKSFVSQRTTKQNANATAAEINALNASRVSQAKSKVSHHTTRQNINNVDEEQQQQYYTERAGNPRSIHNLEDREMRLRELDRELQEKDRLLQMREKELKDRSVMEKSMTRYRAQQEEAEINRSALSQSRKLASQKSLPKEKSLHQSKQRLDESRENTRVLKSQTQLKGQSHVDYDRSNINTNLNKSTSVVVQSRIIPSMSSLNDVDMSPKAFGVSPKHTQPIIKSLTRVGNSVQSIDPYSEFQRSPKNFSAVNSQKVLGVPSAYDVNETSVSRMGQQRTAFQEAYAQSFENSPQSKISPKPQTLERLENSGIKLIDQRGGEDYENSQIYEGGQIYDPTPIHMASPHSDHTRRHITFDTRNLGEIEECESSPQSKSLSRKMSLGERNDGKQGTEYASFRVSFGRTQSKYLRSQSPDIDAKDSLYIVDVARRKKVTHHEQTYDVVQGNEVKYDLNPLGGDYSVSKRKPRSKYEPRDQSSENLDRSQQMASPPCTNRVENMPQ